MPSCPPSPYIDFRSSDSLTAVHKAAVRGAVKALKMLLDLGASPDLRDANGLTALYHCCLESKGVTSLRSVEILLKDHCQVDVRDRQAWTELHHAAKNGLESHIELLLLYGADPNAVNVTGNTPLHVCGTWDQDGAAKV